MTYHQIDARKEYVKRARESFQEQEEDWTHPAPEHEEPAFGKTFSLRLVLGLLLFLLFVLADMTNFQIFDYSTTDIAYEIASKDNYTNLEKYVMMLLTDKN
ncbi:MAG: hypothetical protein MSA09_13030 [Lachnospiraceae bacterium]|nr:hypothetical protein [Lachnospiraceae bacterium]MDD7177834.1 hypothetical protein [bacterium]MDY5517071.1 hypothetical protein [Lachnospiraceae bacterium]